MNLYSTDTLVHGALLHKGARKEISIIVEGHKRSQIANVEFGFSKTSI